MYWALMYEAEFSIECVYIRKNDDQMIVVFSWRRDRDSNPGYLAAHTRSRRANSTTLAPLRTISLSIIPVEMPHIT